MNKVYKYKEIGKRVIKAEQESLLALTDYIDDNFVKACELLYNLKGRVIIAGIGKSGHVARKIAATMSSLGTPAFFVHPAEAIHGDLGMISVDDVIIMLSNSGNTFEIKGMIEYAKIHHVPLIGITSGAHSYLDISANVSLLLPAIPEASTVSPAPTTSTIMAMAIGDAMAVALHEHKDTPESIFYNFHPGGTLGASVKRIQDVSTAINLLPRLSKNSNVLEAMDAIAHSYYNCAAIIENEEPLYIVYADELSQIISSKNYSANLENLGSKPSPNFLTFNDTIEEAEVSIKDSQARYAFVKNNQGKISAFFSIK